MYNKDKVSLTAKLASFIELEKKISISTFYEEKFMDKTNNKFIINTKHDERLVVEFDNNTIEEGKIKEEFKGHQGPFLYSKTIEHKIYQLQLVYL